MTTLEPEFRIYDPPLLLFGGVEVEPPHNPRTFTDEVKEVLFGLGDVYYQAYQVRSRASSLREQVSFRAWPTVAEIDKRCRDDYIGRMKMAQRILRMVEQQNKESALITHENGFYLLQLLRGEYDPVATERVLKAAEAAIFSLVGRRYKIMSSIDSNALSVDAVVIPPKGYII